MSIWDITFWRGGAGYEEGVGTLENNHQISDLHSLWVTEALYLFLSDTILHAHPWNPCFDLPDQGLKHIIKQANH